MRILKTLLMILFAISIVPLSCKLEGALTPEEAFDLFTNAYYKSDADKVLNLLSEESKEKINEIIKMISSMRDDQKKSLSEKFGINIEIMNKLTIKDYISLQLTIGKASGNDVIMEINKHKIIGIDQNGTRAVVRVENGMELNFVKEGPYWKLDMKEL
ncbi:MAG: hypothetical protein SVZ03_16550 [Spirochaetota bacterium]|nr:hypothetical protein [Spirochaetota bacterium]